ncbi:MAG: D-alanine--D-alanine ligase [Candidatus Terrybacteria bacterium CG10_big_fil_rev_8_21_14_0_10_41_10]|uniref:D-alanine--D-alanine ligase n=1 Tax=Candidatus Terrybacteria bacterium CG10_big_fil_rev_8_21_14_0_10_41_10 TaxID=1975026 RepID=A0A2M8LBJ9_9BACT|nr:MAG: D-alanine--D-alanine ligase [Candidatus Terrybacteria bacterium CG10_big_fil_rev_8_21_14_0_10_41_10]
MSLIRVGVLRGGPSSEHEVSLKTGEAVLANLPKKYFGHDIFIEKNGEWNMDGRYAYPEKVFRNVDVVFNALHGYFGEDGKVQSIMEHHGVPYTGSGALASAMGMNKQMAKEAFKRAGLKTPRGILLDLGMSVEQAGKIIFGTISPPWVIKIVNGGSSVGVFIAKDFSSLAGTLETILSPSDGERIMVEEYIWGKEATCGVIDNFRGETVYALPVVEIKPAVGHSFFDNDSKYGGQAQEIIPANFSLAEKREIEKMARLAHDAIGARHYSRSDFIISQNGIYILEINTLPGLTSESLLPKAMNAVGSSYGELLDHLIAMAMGKLI